MNGVGPSKRKRFTPRDKTQILSYLRESNNLRATARKFSVDRKTIRSWVEHQGSLPPPEAVGVAQEENPASNQLITPVDRTPPTKRRRNLTAGEPLGWGRGQQSKVVVCASTHFAPMTGEVALPTVLSFDNSGRHCSWQPSCLEQAVGVLRGLLTVSCCKWPWTFIFTV